MGRVSTCQKNCNTIDLRRAQVNKVDISVDKIFLFKLSFLGFFSVCLSNIYLNIWEHLSVLDLLSFDKRDL